MYMWDIQIIYIFLQEVMYNITRSKPAFFAMLLIAIGKHTKQRDKVYWTSSIKFLFFYILQYQALLCSSAFDWELMPLLWLFCWQQWFCRLVLLWLVGKQIYLFVFILSIMPTIFRYLYLVEHKYTYLLPGILVLVYLVAVLILLLFLSNRFSLVVGLYAEAAKYIIYTPILLVQPALVIF